MRRSTAETARTVFFLVMSDFWISYRRSEAERSSSQSITTRSALLTLSSLSALDGLKQCFVEMARLSSARFSVQITCGSRDTNKHSNARSGVISTSRSGGPVLGLNGWPACFSLLADGVAWQSSIHQHVMGLATYGPVLLPDLT